ncbi:MAG TPA: hypothetical protein VEW70_07630 [Burkholderiales bacterium]|nr:hypothetical protein [Burkholderiales bacterium]
MIRATLLALIGAASLAGCTTPPAAAPAGCPPELRCRVIDLHYPQRHTYDAEAIARWEHEQTIRSEVRRAVQRIENRQRMREITRRVNARR